MSEPVVRRPGAVREEAAAPAAPVSGGGNGHAPASGAHPSIGGSPGAANGALTSGLPQQSAELTPRDATIAGPTTAANGPADARPQPATPGSQNLRRGRGMTLLLGVVAGGLVLGAIAAAASAPLLGTPRVVVTPLPLGAGAGGAAGRGAAAGAG